jgi:hypothetical protein
MRGADNFYSPRTERMFDFLGKLAKQPLFQFLAAWIVLLLTDIRPMWGVIAATVWGIWIMIPKMMRQRTAPL